MMSYGNSPYNLNTCKDTQFENESCYSTLSTTPPLPEETKECNYETPDSEMFDKRHSINSDEVNLNKFFSSIINFVYLTKPSFFVYSFLEHRKCVMCI